MKGWQKTMDLRIEFRPNWGMEANYKQQVLQQLWIFIDADNEISDSEWRDIPIVEESQSF